MPRKVGALLDTLLAVPRETLTRDQIVRAAVAVLDAEGVAGLNMRRLGARLGAAATAMYWHVKSKDELVVLAGDHVWDEIALPDPGIGWQEALAALAEGARAMAVRHFWLVSAMSTHVIYGPGKARFDDQCLGVLEAAGFSEPDADQAAATVLMLVIGAAAGEAGESAWRARIRKEGADEGAEMSATIARVTSVAREFPRLRSRLVDVGGREAERPGGDTFAFGLRAVLDGLAARLAAAHPK